jgi:hypothetical protein
MPCRWPNSRSYRDVTSREFFWICRPLRVKVCNIDRLVGRENYLCDDKPNENEDYIYSVSLFGGDYARRRPKYLPRH